MYLEGLPGGEVAQPANPLVDGDDVSSHVKKIFGGRALARLTPAIQDFLERKQLYGVYLCGGALLRGVPADLDFFPACHLPGQAAAFERFAASAVATPVAQLAEVKVDGVKLQFCRLLSRPKTTLQEVVDAFDFAHCQVGAYLSKSSSGWRCQEVYQSPNFQAAILTGGTFYCGGIWPLRSLARIPKVALKLGLDVADTRELTRQVVKAALDIGLTKVMADDESFTDLVGYVKAVGPFDFSEMVST